MLALVPVLVLGTWVDVDIRDADAWLDNVFSFPKSQELVSWFPDTFWVLD